MYDVKEREESKDFLELANISTSGIFYSVGDN